MLHSFRNTTLHAYMVMGGCKFKKIPSPLVLHCAWKTYCYAVHLCYLLAHYVTGYVTKAEKSNMQEVWQVVNSNSSIYSKIWSFGVRSLHSRECGLYEASDLLLGDHLTEKSVTVKWVDAAMPQKRMRRQKACWIWKAWFQFHWYFRGEHGRHILPC